MNKQFTKNQLTKKSDDLSKWYTEVVQLAGLADYAPVKGCIIIKPYAYAIWEHVQEIFNKWIKADDVQNAYFPLFIPHKLLEKEKEHVKGFSPELAVVTIGGGEKLAEPLVVRPTSETIMYDTFSKWISSWRDLPLKINQWCNIVRWEKRTYPFLRTMEFLWQEGHTVHETEKEGVEMVLKALDWYKKLHEEYYAVPVISGIKSATERFAGGKDTYCIEALMPDGKALQAGTSHNLGQNFAKAFGISFQDKEGKTQIPWQTSWGLSTRSLGGLFLVNGDDNGLIMPPKIAPTQVVIIPISKEDSLPKNLLDYTNDVKAELSKKGIRVHIDSRDTYTPGRKFNEWELKGVPVRFEIGGREVEKKTITVVRRDTGKKYEVDHAHVVDETEKALEQIQHDLFNKAKKFLKENTHEVNSYDEFKKIMETKRGFLRAFWCENPDCETKIKEETKATTRCKPINAQEEKGNCIYCGKDAKFRWYFAQAY